MRKARERQLEMVQAIVHQRDMFSALYKDACNASGRGDAAASLVRSHAESSPARTAAPSAASEAGGTPVSAADAQVQSRLLKDLQESFDQYVLGSAPCRQLPARRCRWNWRCRCCRYHGRQPPTHQASAVRGLLHPIGAQLPAGP